MHYKLREQILLIKLCRKASSKTMLSWIKKILIGYVCHYIAEQDVL